MQVICILCITYGYRTDLYVISIFEWSRLWLPDTEVDMGKEVEYTYIPASLGGCFLCCSLLFNFMVNNDLRQLVVKTHRFLGDFIVFLNYISNVIVFCCFCL